MADYAFNVAKGRAVELYNRVKSGDPSTSRLVLIPLETSGLESRAVLEDADTVAAVLSGTTNEQTTMGRKVLAAADLAAFPAPDDTSNRYDISLPSQTWVGATGNPVSQILLCYEPNNSSPSDSNKIPICVFDRVENPSGLDIIINAGVVYRAT